MSLCPTSLRQNQKGEPSSQNGEGINLGVALRREDTGASSGDICSCHTGGVPGIEWWGLLNTPLCPGQFPHR